jgi:hypothetical protein
MTITIKANNHRNKEGTGDMATQSPSHGTSYFSTASIRLRRPGHIFSVGGLLDQYPPEDSTLASSISIRKSLHRHPLKDTPIRHPPLTCYLYKRMLPLETDTRARVPAHTRACTNCRVGPAGTVAVRVVAAAGSAARGDCGGNVTRDSTAVPLHCVVRAANIGRAVHPGCVGSVVPVESAAYTVGTVLAAPDFLAAYTCRWSQILSLVAPSRVPCSSSGFDQLGNYMTVAEEEAARGAEVGPTP